MKRAIFGLRPVSKEFISGNKWPVEEIKLGKPAGEESADLANEIIEEKTTNKEGGASIEDLISEDGILVVFLGK